MQDFQLGCSEKQNTAPDMQNEMLKTTALLILPQVVKVISIAPFLTIMIDETTDVSNKEQVVICFWWISPCKLTKSS